MSILSLSTSSADADLTKRIGIAFASRPRISEQGIHVFATDGIVTLRGRVASLYDHRLVVALTRHVAAVMRIDDQLVVEVQRVATEAANSRPAPRQPSWKLRRIGSFRDRHYLRACFAGMALVALSFTGCGSKDAGHVAVHPATGAIKFRGQPAAGAFVTLHPREASAEVPAPRATVGPNGEFSLTTYDGDDGAPEGEYTLTVQWYRPVKQGDEYIGGPNVLPQKYASAKTSDLKIRIAAGENRLQPVVLK
jgi:hypothetical protein